MSSPINYALSRIRREIPDEVLRQVFTPTLNHLDTRYRFSASTIDAQIKQKVIDEIVRIDTDTFGTQEVLIPIGDLPRETMTGMTTGSGEGWVVRIPRDRLNGRSITSPLSITLSPYGHTGMSAFGMSVGHFGTSQVNTCGTSSITNLIAQSIDATAPMSLNQTAHVHLIGENTIYCEDYLPQQNLSLRALVSSDPEFTFLRQPSWFDFGSLCVYACQGYIYNNYRIRLDEGQIIGGVSISEFKNVVDGFSDAYENYKSMIKEEWRAIVAINDKSRTTRLVRMLGGGLRR